jgi:GTP-binding protein
MIIKTAEFIISNTDINKCPKPVLPEYAFIGRSNVGKSSLINMLTDNSKLAKTSAQPGKTQVINHFLINKNWYMVDLPGYGYAKAAKTERKAWSGFIKDYLLKRTNLSNVFVLLDARLLPQEIDLDFMQNLGKKAIPFSMVFTKTDKITKAELQKNIKIYETQMLETWSELPKIFFTSAAKKEGKNDILNYIEETNLLLADRFKKTEEIKKWAKPI